MTFHNLRKIIIAIFCGFILGAIALMIIGIDVGTAYGKLLSSMFSSAKNVINCFIYTTPYLLTALAFCISAKAGIFNLGVEGEFIIASVATCATGIILKDLSPFFLVILCVTNGIIASIILGSLVSILKNKFRLNAIFTMIITNYIALHISNFIVNLPSLKSEIGADSTKRISENAIICMDIELSQSLGLPPNMNFSFIVAIFLCILTYLFFKYTNTGHNIINVGINEEACDRSGIDIYKTNFYSLMLSAVIAGFAGSIYVISIGKRLSVLPAFEGYGFTGILVALFSNSNPLLIIPSSLIFGSLKYAGRSLNIVNAPSQIIDLIISSIILIAATSFILKRRRKK